MRSLPPFRNLLRLIVYLSNLTFSTVFFFLITYLGRSIFGSFVYKNWLMLRPIIDLFTSTSIFQLNLSTFCLSFFVALRLCDFSVAKEGSRFPF